MRTPESLVTLVEHGIIQEVVRPLMSGKEAQVYVVLAGGEECVAKVYKEATERTFKHRVEYTEGRRTRNTRDQRAINKRTRHGRKQDEAAWRNAEVDTLYRLRGSGVRVPEPINFIDGVLVMELVRDAEGNPAARLGDLEFAASEAYAIYQKLIQEVVRMLCAGVIHGDLSEFNVLMGADGPVVIDFPQSVDPAKNQSARRLLLRDVENLHRFLRRFSPRRSIKPYAQQMWSLYETNRLEPDTELSGNYRDPVGTTNTDELMELIEDANQDEQMRRDARGDEAPVNSPATLRTVVDFTKESKPRARSGRAQGEGRSARSKPSPSRASPKPGAGKLSSAKGDVPKKRRRSRRRRARSNEAGPVSTAASSRGETTTAERTKEKDKVASGEADRTSRRKRGGQAATRSRSGTTGAGRQANAQRSTTTAPASSADGSLPVTNEPRPSPRRRRRRSRAKAPREKT